MSTHLNDSGRWTAAVDAAAAALHQSFADDEGYAAPVGVVEWRGMAKAALAASGLFAEVERLRKALTDIEAVTDPDGQAADWPDPVEPANRAWNIARDALNASTR